MSYTSTLLLLPRVVSKRAPRKVGIIILAVILGTAALLFLGSCVHCFYVSGRRQQNLMQELANRREEELEANAQAIPLNNNINTLPVHGLTSAKIDQLEHCVFIPGTDSDSNYQTDKLCTICLSDYKKKEKLLKLPCKHAFHKKCAAVWLQSNSTCPFCSRLLSEPVQPPRPHIAVAIPPEV